MIKPIFTPNDKKARIIIAILSVVVFLAVIVLHNVKLEVNLGIDKHVFAKLNAGINSIVSLLLIFGLLAVKSKKFILHKRIMLSATALSALFLVSYILHHLFAGDAIYGGSPSGKIVYLIILFSHILLAALILPFILYTVYRGLTGEYEKHKKMAKKTWPIWFYVSVTGVIVYFMISPYYN